MKRRHRIPMREIVFIESLRRHGFRLTKDFSRIKRRYGYVVPASDREDASGVDFFVKMPREDEIYEVQVTQRGDHLSHIFCRYESTVDADETELQRVRDSLSVAGELHLENKREICYRHNIALVMVQDYPGERSNPTLAWRDVKALRYGVNILKSRMQNAP